MYVMVLGGWGDFSFLNRFFGYTMMIYRDQSLYHLCCLEVVKKFMAVVVVVGGLWVVCKHFVVFSFGFDQAEQ